MAPKRAIGEKRISNETDETTSPERQDAQITGYCGLRDWELIHMCEDLDVSGGISPFDRGDLGKWLTAPEYIEQWDVLVVGRLDRLTRSLFDFADLLRWCEANGKAIAVVAENFDLTTAVGRATAMIIIVFAQLMREQTAENRRAAQDTLRAAMLYGGGPVHYGYEAYQADGHWPLRLCRHEVATVNYWADQVIDHGRSASSLTVEMRARGILTKNGKPFSDGRILEILRSPVLRGYVRYWPPKLPEQKGRTKPQIVLGHDGMPLRREAVLTDDRWFALQAALDRNGQDSPAVRRDASPLLGVVVCLYCGSRLGYDPYQDSYAYYRCPKTKATRSEPGKRCKARSIPAAWLRDRAEEVFLAAAGDVPIKTRIAIEDSGHAAQIAAIGRQIAELTTEKWVLGVEREGIDEVIERLKQQHAELSALPVPKPKVRWKNTGRTVASEWASRDENGQRLLMIDAGFTISIIRVKSGYALGHTFDPDLERRAGLAATGSREVPAIPNELTGALVLKMFDRHGNPTEDNAIVAELGITEDVA